MIFYDLTWADAKFSIRSKKSDTVCDLINSSNIFWHVEFVGTADQRLLHGTKQVWKISGLDTADEWTSNTFAFLFQKRFLSLIIYLVNK